MAATATAAAAKHTDGAIRAAEAITGGKYGSRKLYATAYGRKTVEGVADLIENETAAGELLALCEKLLARFVDAKAKYMPRPIGDDALIPVIQAAIAKAKGGAA